MLVLCFLVTPVPVDAMLAFLMGSVLLVLGMGLFNLGTDLAMTRIGESVGSALTRSKKLWLILSVGFLVGVMVTVSEPDLTVLASQVPAVPDAVLILSVALGVGVFLVLALVRILFQIRMWILLLIAYGIVFLLTPFVPSTFLAVAFDAGGVTTGPMTVPFILALGLGVASIRSDNKAESDSFGLVSLCSIGPILTVMLLGILYRPDEGSASTISMISADTSVEITRTFYHALPEYVREVGIALLPIALFFVVFQLAALHLHRTQVFKILSGLLYTFLGLVLFLTGVNVGFMPVGNCLGRMLGSLEARWVLIPIGMLIGYFTVSAEPAVQVLCHQVYDMTAGAVSPRALSLSLSVGVSLSVGLAMLRVITGISILYFLIPGYAIAFLLMIFTPPVFTSIAFDSGGVASGPMTATFLLPFAMGACEACGGNLATDAFAVVAMVAMTPLIAIQALGLVYRARTHQEEALPGAEDIIEL
ncbi:MAG: DUF1538 domain-containing protein [Clostridia bacterium]|nr:DUF1538 domain-containing protein [Clostridia bacterium]